MAKVLFLVFLCFGFVHCNCPRPDSLTRTSGGQSMCAMMYEHSHWVPTLSCGGKSLQVGIEQTTGVMPPGGWNDVISSVVVRSGCQLTGFEDGQFKGDKKSFTGVHRLVDSHFNDVISSYYCTCDFDPIKCTDTGDRWVMVQSCNTVLTDPGMAGTCDYEMEIGTEISSTQMKGGSVSHDVQVSIGLEIKKILSLGAGYKYTTGYNWRDSHTELYTTKTTQIVHADNVSGKITKIYQAQGYCDDNNVKTSRYKIEQTDV